MALNILSSMLANRRRCALLMVLALATVACRSSESDSTGTTAAASATSVTEAATTTATPATTTTTTTTEPTTTSDPRLELPAEGEAWDLVYLSNSFGYRVAQHYATHAEKALGVTVKAHEQALSRLTAQQALQHLQDLRYPKMGDLIRNAEIIVIYGVPNWEVPESREWLDTCWYDQRNSPAPTKDYTEEDWQEYRQELEALFAEVWHLRQGLPTVLRTVDAPIGMISDWREVGKERECIAGWESNFAVLRQAAEAQGVTLVPVFDLFNGPNHDEDPRERGWIEGDGYHPNDAGAAAIAEALAAVGFEPNHMPEP